MTSDKIHFYYKKITPLAMTVPVLFCNLDNILPGVLSLRITDVQFSQSCGKWGQRCQLVQISVLQGQQQFVIAEDQKRCNFEVYIEDDASVI